MDEYTLLSPQLEADWTKSKEDVSLFVKSFASPRGKLYIPLECQEIFIKEMMSGNFNEGWMSGGNSAGKTWTGKWLGTFFPTHKIKPGKPPWKDYSTYMRTPYHVLCTGPEQKQATELWEAIEQAFKDSPILKHRVAEVRTGTRLKSHPYIRLKNGALIEAVGLHDKGRHVEGEAYDLVLINEPADVRSLIHCLEKVLTPRTWRRGGVICGFGTPKSKGEYWLVFRRGLREGQHGHLPQYEEQKIFSMYADSRNNPFAEQEKISEFLNTKNESLILERIEGRFIDESALAFPETQIEACIKEDLKLPIDPSSGHFYITGVDFGRKEDYTCAITLDISSNQPPYPLVNYWRAGGGVVTWEEILGELLKIYNNYYGEFIVDATASAGDMQTEWLRDLGITFVPYQFAGSPAKKTNLITNLQKMFGNREFVMPFIAQLREELHMYPKNMDDKGIETDSVMALALAGFGAKEYGPIGSVEPYNR